MKAKELMIGDWFVCSDPHPFKVVSIEFDDPYYRVWGNDGFPVDLGDLEPIPLTEEILKENGFVVDERYDDGDVDFSCNGYEFNTLNCIKYHNEEGYQFSICGFNDYNSVSKRCLYVHELQHALRLYGLNELADNFKTHSQR